jgi:hypothetical protein
MGFLNSIPVGTSLGYHTQKGICAIDVIAEGSIRMMKTKSLEKLADYERGTT